jgi:tetratricopeptide (TPR) repeat protein
VEAARYWAHRRKVGVARRALSRAVDAAMACSSVRSEALTWLAFFEAEDGDLEPALAHLRDAVDDARAAGDRARAAGAGAVASVLLRDRDPSTARRHADDAVDLFVAHGTRREIAYGWTTHALAALAAGSPDDAAESARAAAAIYAELGDRRGLAWTRATQSRIAATLGDDEQAEALHAEARTIALDVEDVRTVRRLSPPR